MFTWTSVGLSYPTSVYYVWNVHTWRTVILCSECVTDFYLDFIFLRQNKCSHTFKPLECVQTRCIIQYILNMLWMFCVSLKNDHIYLLPWVVSLYVWGDFCCVSHISCISLMFVCFPPVIHPTPLWISLVPLLLVRLGFIFWSYVTGGIRIPDVIISRLIKYFGMMKSPSYSW